MSQTVSYIGASDNRVVSSANLLAAGFTSPDLVWNKANSFENIVSDAIAAYLLTLGSFVIEGNPTTFADLFRRTIVPDLRGTPTVPPTAWDQIQWTNDAAVTSVAQTFEHGHSVMRMSGGTAVARSNDRRAFKIPSSPGGYSRIRSRWIGRNYASTSSLIPQRGHVHGAGIQADGKRRGVVVWHDIAFNSPSILNLGVWQADANGDNFLQVSGVVNADIANVSAAARNANVVTLTVPSGHGFVKGDLISVDLADNSYDGTFEVSSVTSTTIVYGQTAANAGTTTGTVTLTRSGWGKGDLVRSASLTGVTRTGGKVTGSIGSGHPFQVNDWIDVDGADNSYDGQFRVSALPAFATQIQWNQAATDAAATTASISKIFPYWVESEWRPNGLIKARVWPDGGMNGGGGANQAMSESAWEGWWSAAASFDGVASGSKPDPARGVGCYLLAAHLGQVSDPTMLGYDSIECESLS